MEEFLRYQKTISVIILGVLLAGAVALGVAMPDNWQYGAGLLWGGAGGLVMFRMKVLAIIRFAANPKQPPSGSSQFRQLVVAAVFLAVALAANHYLGPSLKHDVFNKWTVFAGIFLPSLVLATDGLLRPAAMVAAGAPKGNARGAGAAPQATGDANPAASASDAAGAAPAPDRQIATPEQ